MTTFATLTRFPSRGGTSRLLPSRCCSLSSSSYSERVGGGGGDGNLMIQWIRDKGGFVHSGLQVGHPHSESQGEGQGLFTRLHIPSNTPLISLPPHIPISLSLSKPPHPLLSRLSAQLPDELWTLKLALRLLVERAQFEDSFWWPYICNLPQAFNVPIFFKREEVAALQYAPVIHQVSYLVIHQVNTRCKMLLDFSKHVMTEVGKLPPQEHPFGGQDVDPGTFGWAMAAVSSRAFRLCSKGMSDRVLLPLVDMCNHSFNANSTIVLDPSTDSDSGSNAFLQVISKERIQEGSMISLDYGCLSNDLLLLDYGFSVPGNKYDLIEIKYDKRLLDKAMEEARIQSAYFMNPTSWQKEMLTLLQLEGDNKISKVDFGGDNLVDGRLIAALRILFAEDQNDVTKYDLMSLQSLDSEAPFGLENEIKTLKTVIVLCAILLGYFQTTVEEDEKILKRSDIAEAMKLAIRFRITKKELLSSIMKTLTRKLSKIRQTATK